MENEGYPGNPTWFEDHFTKAPQEIVDFLGGDGISLQGLRVADIGTGDGIMALGLSVMARPELLVGYDIEPTDIEDLQRMAKEHGIDALPEGLRFELSAPDHVPAPSGTFDFILSWSAFEHIEQPRVMAQEIRRLMAPGAIAMIQLFPFYHSEHGDHGWTRPGFEHLITGVDCPDYFLNRLTVDDLQDTLTTARLQIAKVELIHHPFHLPAELAGRRLTDLAIGGIKLLAVPV